LDHGKLLPLPLIRIIPAGFGAAGLVKAQPGARTGSKMTRFHGIAEMIIGSLGVLAHPSGTGGSNPLSSSGESVSQVPSMPTGAKTRLSPEV
jgi:hypothetical protein